MRQSGGLGVSLGLMAPRPVVISGPPRPMPNPFAAWAAGRSPWWRLLLLLYLGYAGARELADPTFRSIFGGIDFGAHELGHLVFAFFGETASVAGGTIMQLLIPIGAAALLSQRHDYFGVAVTAGWFALSLLGVAQYVGDARAQELTLLGFSPDPIHDWEYLLGKMGLLAYDTRLAALLRLSATLLLAGALGAGGYLCRLMMLHRTRPHEVS